MAAGLEYGIKITADSKLAVGAARDAEKAVKKLDRQGKTLTTTSEKQTRSSGRQQEALRTLARETQKASSKLSSLERQTRVQTRAVLAAAKANRDAARAIAQGRAATERATGASRVAEAQNRRTAASAINLASAMRLVGGLSLVLLAKQTVSVADSWTLMEGRMSLVVRTGETVSTVMDDLHRRAQDARAGFAAFNKVYFRTARALSQHITLAGRAADVTSILAKSARISGAGAQESAAGLLQLSQALSSGELRGEEFRSVMENIPDVAKRIADGLGEPITALRGLAEAGELTTEKVGAALLSQKDAVEAEFKKLPRTVAEAWVQLGNDITRELGEGSRATNATGGLINAIDRLRAAVSTAIPVGVQLLAVTADLSALAADNLDTIVALASGYIAARVALKAFTVVQASSLGTMVKSRAVTLGLSALMAGNYARALKVATIGWRGLTAAMVANPIGAVAVGIGLVTAALVGWGLASDDAAEKTDRLSEANERLQKAMEKMTRAGLEAELALQQTILARGAEAREHILGAIRKAKGELDDLRENLTVASQPGIYSPRPLNLNNNRDLEAIRKKEKELKGLQNVLAGITSSGKETQDTIDKITVRLARLDARQTAVANKKLLQHFDGLLKTLDPAAQRTLELARAYGALRAAREAGRISQDEHAAYLERLRSELYPDAARLTERTTESLKEEARSLGLSARERQIQLTVRQAENEARQRGLELTRDNITAIEREAGAPSGKSLQERRRDNPEKPFGRPL